MKNIQMLKEMLCDELEEIAGRGVLSSGDLETINKLTASIKNIDKIIMADRYSYDGIGDGSYRTMRYSYDGRGDAPNWRYSSYDGIGDGSKNKRSGSKERLAMEIEELMRTDELSHSERTALERALKSMN